jgi:hypothetical protein
MTTLTPTLALLPVAPTRAERAMLALSGALSAMALARMQRRAATAGRRVRRSASDEAQRDLAAQLRAGMLPR